ncbi:hypothetical protein IFR05_000402 [Cadophora sp. M221]|nr:hypothetical protein IFR05_000402 [Cadophora sp. M221]
MANQASSNSAATPPDTYSNILFVRPITTAKFHPPPPAIRTEPEPKDPDEHYKLSIGRLLLYRLAVMFTKLLGEDTTKAENALEGKWFTMYNDADFVLLQNCWTDYRSPGPHVRSRAVHHAMNTVYDTMAAEDPLTVTQADLSKYRRLYQQIEDRHILENQNNPWCNGMVGHGNRDPDHNDAVYDGDSDLEDANYESHQPIVRPDDEEFARRVAANPQMEPGDDFPGSFWGVDDIELEDGDWRVSEEDATSGC